VECLKVQLEDQESRHEDDLKEQARMMDIKTARAAELESRLKDIAYGTRQYQLEGGATKDGGREAEVEGVDVVLEHGQNLLQLGVRQVKERKWSSCGSRPLNLCWGGRGGGHTHSYISSHFQYKYCVESLLQQPSDW